MLEYNGKLYARVSEIITEPDAFDHIDKNVLRNKQDIGTNTHDAICDLLNNEFPVVKGRAKNYLKSFLAWSVAISPYKTIQTEKRYFCDSKMITGKLDALFQFPNEAYPTLLDWKTSASESPSWILQAHLYHYLLEVNDIQVMPRFLFVKLHGASALPSIYQYQYSLSIRAKCFQLVDSFWEKHNCRL